MVVTYKEQTMTTQSITSDRTQPQEKQFKRFVEDTGDRALVEVNPDKDAIQRLIGRGGEFQDWVIEGIRRFSAKLPDYILAQSILGADFITPEEIMATRRGVAYTNDEIATLAASIPSADMLRWCKDNGYAVMPAPPTAMSLLDVRQLVTNHFYSKTGGWYADQEFASKDKTSFGWLAIRKTPVPNSTNRTWSEQEKLLSGVESVPNAAEMSWFITMYFEVRGIRLFANVYVRTSSLDSGGDRVLVGGFGAKGLYVYSWDDYYRHSYIGVSSARK
ncbi:MAG: hypothetical protein AAB460_00255 [Patescibacteria group bacterium]